MLRIGVRWLRSGKLILVGTALMQKRLRRMFCLHKFMWSERRQAEVCYLCGQSRSGPGPGSPPTILPGDDTPATRDQSEV